MRFEQSFEAYIEVSNTCASILELKSRFGLFAAAEGYENHVLTTVGDRQLASVAWFELPDKYPQAYISERWEQIDPILPAARRARVPFYWAEALQDLTMSPSQKAFFEECRSMGVRDGIVIPIHGPDRRCDILSLSRRTGEAPDVDRLPLIRAVAAQTWCRFLELSGTDLTVKAQSTCRITPREFQVLRWIKAGKTNFEIAELLGIGRKSVEFHVHNLLDKLGAPNRISAVVIALHQGLIN